MKKVICIILAIAMMVSAISVSATATSENASGKYVDEFVAYLENQYVSTEDGYCYEELYEYYSDDNKTDVPSWVLVRGGSAYPAPGTAAGIFNNYYIFNHSYDYPYPLGYFIYIPEKGNFYTLEFAFMHELEGIDEAFSECLVKKGLAQIIEDTNDDQKITIDDTYNLEMGIYSFNSFLERPIIYFDANTVDWEDYEKVYCGIYKSDGTPLYQEYSQNYLCTDFYDKNLWEYDLYDLSYIMSNYSPLTIYFYNEKGQSTSYLTLDNLNIGDTVLSVGENTDGLQLIRWKKDKSAKDAIAEYEAQTGEKVETNRYYFLMPNGTNSEVCDNELYPNYGELPESWYNEHGNTAGIYWWDSGVFDPESWPGYLMDKGDSESVYYADIPSSAKALIFNNFVDRGFADWDSPVFNNSYQSINLYTYGYDEGESSTYPEGLDSFNNMIYVISTDCDMEMEPNNDWGGEWYYYYGDGCYGTVKDGSIDDCIRDDHDHEFLFKDKFIDQFISEYETEIAKYMAYEEQYYHYDENGDIDWALIYADKYITEPWNYHIIYEDSILMYGSRHPFSFGYGIYDAKTGEFHDIITDKGRSYEFDLSAYDGLEEVFDSLKIGYPIGDANHDHELSIMDATHIQLVLAKLATFDYEDSVEYYHGYKDWSELGYPKYISDINCDGERNILDATAIQMKLAKLA